MELNHIDHIIFDLGGVFINLNEGRTIDGFAGLSKLTRSEIENKIHDLEEYKLFEKGLMEEHELRTLIREEFKVEAPDTEIDDCFNAMLLDIPAERLLILENLKNKFDLFLLSNTNSIHFKKFNEIAEASGIRKIDSYFTKAYYSHLIRMRKPDPEIFEKVIQENDLQPTRTLFIDDNQANVEGAQTLGIKTFHLKNPSQLFQLFK